MVKQHEQRNPIEVLAEEFIEQRRTGEAPTIKQFAAAHPELTDEIKRLFPAIVAMEQVQSFVVNSNERPIELRVDKLEKLGDYRILREIGRGGMGIVYEAEQQSLGRLVAVKVFPQQVLKDSKKLERFRREARVAALLHHTNIVQVFGAGDQDGLSYYVMQLIRGVSLDRVIDQLRDPASAQPVADTARNEVEQSGQSSALFTAATAARAILGGGFEAWSAPEGQSTCSASLRAIRKSSSVDADGSWQLVASEGGNVPQHVSSVRESSTAVLSHHHSYWQSVAQIGVQVGEALRYAHLHGTLHRDIKPSNLLLDPKGTVWVTDFGVAKAVSQEQISRPGDVVGTLRYMPPEQLAGDSDTRSDIYSLGLTLYELITLRTAFGDTSEDGLVHRKLEKDPVPPRKLQPGVPRDLETIVLKAIARAPGRRYQTAGELVDDLTRFLDGRPVRARRVGPAERLWRWSRRNPAVATLSALLLLVAVCSFSAISWEWRETEFEKRRAQDENRRAESNLSLALDSMDQFLDRFESTWIGHPRDAESEVTDVGFHVPISNKSAAILEDALLFYDQFAAQNSANPRLQHDTANAYRRVGEIYARLGEYDKAKDACCRAIEIYRKQSQQSAPNSDSMPHAALALNTLGRVEMILGRLEASRTHFNQARQLLAKRVGDAPPFPYELAHTHSNLGSVLWYQGKPEEAVRNDRQAIQLLEQLVAEHPRKAEYRLALARAYRRYHPNRNNGAEERKRDWFRAEAVSTIEELVQEFPQVPDYQCELSETLAMVTFESFGFPRGPRKFGRHRTPESHLRRAVDLAKGITDKYPEIPRYRGALARSQKDLARLLHTTNRPRMAEALIADAVEIYEDLWEEFPAVTSYQFFLAAALQSHGDVLRDLGRLTDSRQAIERSIEQQESYLKANPDAVFGRSMLARQNDSLAKTLALLDADDEADEAARRAKEIRDTFLKELAG